MKKKISILVALVMLLTVFAVPISAYGKEQSAKINAFQQTIMKKMRFVFTRRKAFNCI